MRTVIAAVLCLVGGLLGGAWSARGEIDQLRDETKKLRRERDRAKRAKTAADLAMIARLGQAERACRPDPEDRARPAEPAAPHPVEPVPPAAPPAPPPRATDGGADPPFPPLDQKEALEAFVEDAELSEAQKADIDELGVEFQRKLEEAIGGAVARFAFAEVTGEMPRPRDVAETADGLLHTYLEADDELRSLLDEDQVEILDESEFDVLWLVDFEAIGRIAQRAEQDARP
jgi:hypothetical protein